MIRPRWFAHAKAPLARPRAPLRLLSSRASPPPGFGDDANGEKKTTKPSDDARTDKKSSRPELASWWKLKPSISVAHLLPHERRGREFVAHDFTKKKGQHQVIIKGASPSLQASDFARIAAQDLSEWQSAITDFSQERDPWTFEPLGNFVLTFPSHDAAIMYQAKLERLVRLARHKESSPSDLWSGTAPAHLRSHEQHPEDELAAFTLAPGTLAAPLSTKIGRVTGRWPWQHLAGELVQRSGYTLDPALVLVDLHHSSLTTADLQAFINQDGDLRNQPWAIKSLYNLSSTIHDGKRLFKGLKRRPLEDDPAFRKKIRNRFVMVCKSPGVAWRFIRSWNQRVLTKEVDGKTLRTVLTASYIEL